MYLVGKRLALVGTWETALVPADRIPIYLNPIDHSTDEGALVFGYTNLTTQAILEQLEKETVLGETVFLDIGVGSGIVAIAAKLLGAKTVIATEKNPRAIKVAKENIAANSIKIDLRNTDKIPNNLPKLDLASVNFGSWMSGNNLKARDLVNTLPLKDTGKVLVTMGELEDVDDGWEVEDRFSLEAPTVATVRASLIRQQRSQDPVERLDLAIIRRR